MKRKKRFLGILMVLILSFVSCGRTNRTKESVVDTLAILGGNGQANDSNQTNETVISSEGLTVTESPNFTNAPTQSPTLTKSPTPSLVVTPTPQPMEVTLVAIGDDLLHKKVIQSGELKGGTYNFDHIFEQMKEDFTNADLAVINQETIFGTKEMGYSGYPRFNSPIFVGDAIINAGFDVVLHATNHVMDMGIFGIEKTLNYWSQQKEITVLGIHASKQSNQAIKVVEKNGIRFALLNYTYGTNGIPVPKDKDYMVDLLVEAKVKLDIKKAKEVSDFIIVFPHWGSEYVYQPNKYQKHWSQLFAKEGVDLVIGTHPHVLQPVEWVLGEDGHRMLVYYSLGNYVSTMDYTDRMLGGMAQVTIVKVGSNTFIKEALLIPTVTHYERVKGYGLQVYRLSDYTEELAKKHYILGGYRGKDFSLQRLNELVTNIIGDFHYKIRKDIRPKDVEQKLDEMLIISEKI